MILDIEAFSKATPEDMQKLSHQKLIRGADIIGKMYGVPILKAGHREGAVQSQLTDDLDNEFQDEVESVLEPGLNDLPANPTPEQASKLIDRIGKELKTAGVGATSIIVALRGWARAARGSMGRLSARVPGTATIRPSLSLRDEGAIEALSGQTSWWVGDFWTSHMGKRISETVTEFSIKNGLGREDVGRIVRGMMDGEFPGVGVPGTYPGSSREYFSGLAGTIRNQAANASGAYAAEDAGLEALEIVAVKDERTSEVCNELDGQIISVENAVAHADAVTASGDPQSYLQNAAWKTLDQTKSLLGRGEFPGLPPYHASCRTITVPSR